LLLHRSKKFTQTEFKLGNKNVSTNQSARIFNNYFINTVDELITQQTNIELAMFSLRESFPYEFPQIIHIPFTETAVRCTISSLQNNNLCSYDGIYNKILKLYNSQISKPITYIYNNSLNFGICPKQLKYAFIKPCFKKGNKSQIPNYRPIPLLPGFSKIFELLIFHRLKQHLISNNFLANAQFGFHDNISTENVVFKLIESIFNAWYNKQYVTGIFCDLTKAFYGVSHEVLISKFQFHGVKGSKLNCL